MHHHKTKFATVYGWKYNYEYMGDFFQDYSWIQDFEADFPQKVNLKMLN